MMTTPSFNTANNPERYNTNLRPTYKANNAKALPSDTSMALPLPVTLQKEGETPLPELPFSSKQGVQAQHGSQYSMFTDAIPPRLELRNTRSKEGLSQFNKSGDNVVQAKDYKGSVKLNQQVQNGQNQDARFDGVQGNVTINQEGRSSKGNEIVLKDVVGSTTLQSFNAIGDVYIEGTGMKGLVSINASTNPSGINKIDLKDLRLGASIRALGSSDMAIDQAQDSISLNVKGRQGQVEDFRIKVSNVKSDKINTIRLEGQKEDSAWVDLAGNTNASEVFLQGIGNTVFINGKNNQKDILHVEGDAILDLTQLDDNDTVVTHLADGSTVSKSVTQLNELKLLRTMTPQKATQLLKDNFGAFESLLDADKSRKDNLASFDELVAYTKLPTADPSVKAAAQFYINNRATTFDVAEGINTDGRKDKMISLEDVSRFNRVLDGKEELPLPKTAAELQVLDAIKNMTALQATTILKNNFSLFESLMDGNKNNKDNVAQFGELVAYTQLASADPLVKAAAQYFIDHRAETFDRMEVGNDERRSLFGIGAPKDGIFSLGEMTKFETALKGYEAAKILKTNFSAFESLKDNNPNRKDNLASFEEIVAYSQLSGLDPSIKAAAQFFVDNRTTTFDVAEGINAGGRRDGLISLDEMDKFSQQLPNVSNPIPAGIPRLFF
jgi:hypothetical protein